MKKFYSLLLVVGIAAVSSCSKDNPAPEQPKQVDTSAQEKEMEVKRFMWRAMNAMYLWQDNVPNLADDRFKTQEALNSFLSNSKSVDNLFGDLLYYPAAKYPDIDAVDKYSTYYNDFSDEPTTPSIPKSNGMGFALSASSRESNDLFGYVTYVLPNSDAAAKNIKRGDYFDTVNGTPLNKDNYIRLLFNSTSNYYNLNINKGPEVTLSRLPYTENPILEHRIIESGNHKIAYLVFNFFNHNFDNELNTVFAKFKEANATDLVLDLRYNSGGEVVTAVNLASMITGQFKDQVFYKTQWNNKLQANYKKNNPEKTVTNFSDKIKENDFEQAKGAPINSLNLSKVYVLTSFQTASASELTINCLKPYIDVVLIGDKTVGKNVGSTLLFDSPDFSNKNRNTNHKYVLQPMLFKVLNKNNFGEYKYGFSPTHENELYEDPRIPLGEPTEILLSKAISQITGSARKSNRFSKKSVYEIKNTKGIHVPDRGIMLTNPRGLK
jgi:carboxyl-terminal processing protease